MTEFANQDATKHEEGIPRMSVIRIQGGPSLKGVIEADGSKNAALPILAATLAVRGPVRIDRVPAVQDVSSMRQLLQQLGASVQATARDQLLLDSSSAAGSHAPYEFVRRMRASICVLGPLLARHGIAQVAMPGGCQIGQRPIDLHLHGLAALGADIRFSSGNVIAEARRLRGAELHLCGPGGSTVTGTCNVMTAATLAKGRTIIHSAAREPEVVDLGRFLNGAGARISGLGSSVIEIDGVEELHGVQHQLITDRIETATLAIAAIMTRGDVTIANAPITDLTSVLAALEGIGADVRADGAGLRVRPGQLWRPVRLRARPYPGLPTDVQALITGLLSLVPGESVLTDAVFPDRFLHVGELNRLGADLRVHGNTVSINGAAQLRGAPVAAPDLRAAAALVLAGLVAEGVTEVSGTDHLDRGYVGLERKLQQLGATIERLDVESSLRESAVPAPHFDLEPARQRAHVRG